MEGSVIVRDEVPSDVENAAIAHRTTKLNAVHSNFRAEKIIFRTSFESPSRKRRLSTLTIKNLALKVAFKDAKSTVMRCWLE